jgi:hypothetical protein
MANGKPTTVRYSAADVDRACALYATGLSLRAVEAATGIGASAARKFVRDRGLSRHRLAFHPSLKDRLERGYEVAANGCWIWRGTINNAGYGITSDNGRKKLAHRAMRELVGRPIPPGMDACHSCDTPACINPDHIFAGSRADNMRDAARKGRTRRGEQVSSAKLSASVVRQMRELFAAGVRQARIAERFGVDPRHVHAVVRGHLWRHVA